MNASRTTVRSASPAKLLATAALAALSLTVAGVAATPAAAAPSGTGSTSRGPLPTASSNGWAGAGIKYHQSQTQKQQPNTGSPNTGSPNTVSPSTTSSYRSAPPGYPQGIDVSSNDHDYGTPPDWPTLAANGYTFAYVKATEGTTYTNPYFATDYAAAKQNGLDVGAYVFARPDSPDPAAQADYLYQQMKWTADGKTLPPMIDMEWPYFSGYNACYNLTVDQMVNWLTTFVKELRGKIGVAPVIYTAPSWWQQCTNNSAAFTSSPLFVSSCATTPPAVPGWSTWTFWQYDIKACGDDPPNDQDVFNGTVTQLNNLAYPLGNSCFPPMVGDTNGDHHADTVLMCHRPDNSIGLFTSLGDATGAFGTFTSGYTLPPNAWDWNSFRTISGDFNGDGRADVAAMYHFSTGAISMCTSLADTNGLLGSFNCSLNIPASAGWNWSAIRLFAGDANGDGRADAIMEYHFSDNSIQLFTSLGDTNGGFGAFTGSYKLPANAWDWNAFRSIPGDFNGDGRADLAVMYHYSTGAISMCTSLADASGGFGPFNCSLNIPASAGWNWSAIRLYSGDANGDAHADAIMEYHYSDNSIQLFTSLGDTNGGFGAYTGSYKLPANAWDWNAYRSAVGDVNGDSRADMVAGYHFPSGSLGLCTSQADANGLFGSYTMSVSVPVASTWTWRAV